MTCDLSTAGSITTFSGEANMCPRCNKKVYFGEYSHTPRKHEQKGVNLQRCCYSVSWCVYVCVFVFLAEKVTSLGKDWHRPCLRCERCSKTLSAGSHAEVRKRGGKNKREIGKTEKKKMCIQIKYKYKRT